MRGQLSYRDRLSEVIASMLADTQTKEDKQLEAIKREKIFIPDNTPASHLAWDFGGEVKFLDECTKEELLYVCQALCNKIQSSGCDPTLPDAA